MAELPALTVSQNKIPNSGMLVVLIPHGGELPNALKDAPFAGQLERAVKLAEFQGKKGASLSVPAPDGGLDAVMLLGTGEATDLKEADWLGLGGKVFAAHGRSKAVTLFTQTADDDHAYSAQALSTIAIGAKLRAYSFDKYKTKKKEDEDGKTAKGQVKITLGTEKADELRKHLKRMDGVSDGVVIARDLVNEPANVLGPVEFADEAAKLKKLGVDVEILDEKKMKKLGMDALLGVAQGSERPARMAIMQWNGGKKDDQPLAFIGKGVVFDTGGISIKPSGGMEDMKGDMGGAAAVTGLMHALASRKAKANVVGIIGLVENMPDGKAQRPGDIVTSMSGQTIEIINTDAEGRLVLADALWYCRDRFKPKFMIDLATLTGAVLVALGKEHAGIFSNDDDLAQQLSKAGEVTGEKVWRLPLAKAYDKMIDTKNADMKNTGGRYAGSITAAQFLQRFVEDTPWAHIDVAGTAMAAPQNDYTKTWGSGYGVRLLDRLVSEFYEG